MIVIGIDPGLTGSLAMIGHRGVFEAIHDMPVMQRGGGKSFVKNQVNGSQLEELLSGWLANEDKNAIHFFIETPIAFPGQQVAVTASTFLTAGLIEGVIQARHYPHTLVRPQDWKKALGLTSNKEQARARAIRLYPEAAPLLSRVKDHNRAEALLIARYGWDVCA